ncbi:acyl-CoA dehydrogenase, mitochondrial precursor, putative [Bodo saltans]|uniref:Acyl-CoA dehydrogenase, mitochondrial, putative n=1 Tax=Bodo saltans TaxID=75058 RepID=A0A0S4JAW1_BODSA|nr:acyl-CoA dehydrogenase, mitochondrial precursor, putative [Bodo saltans]|eukprot:CUG87081.1 acyl-CoA dehydrogenase, mitochondrial precursor, putative [Bodo saltans]
MRGSSALPRASSLLRCQSASNSQQCGVVFTSLVMQRQHCSAAAAAAAPSSSLAAGFFKVKIHPKEMFPFPTRSFAAEEGDNLETIVRNVQEKQLSTTLKDVVEWGAAGSPIATEYGGLQLSETAHSVSLEELARHAPSAAFLSLLQHGAPCAYLLKSFASNSVRARYLGGMSDASMKMSWAVQEPHAGDDVSMNLAVAKAHEDGSYTITGTKLVAFASDATHFLVMARAPSQTTGTDGAPVTLEKATFFIVERSAKGVSVVVGPSSSDRCLVSFEGALAHDIVGVVGEGHVQYMVTLHSTHHLASAAIVGVLKRMYSIALTAVREDVAAAAATAGSPAPTTTATLLPALVSSSAVEIFGLESALYALTANLDVPVGDSLIEATISAALIARSAQSISSRLSTALQYRSSAENTAMTTAVNDLNRLLALTETPEFLYSVAACCGTEDFGLYFQKASTLETMQLRAMRGLGFRDSLPNSIGSTWPEAKRIEDAVLKFGAAVEHVFIRQNVRLRHSSLTLNRIGEAAALLYASVAAVSRVQLLEKKGVAGVSKKMATQFITYAMTRVEELCDECRNSGKTADEAFKRIALECAEIATRLAGGVPEAVPEPVPEARAPEATVVAAATETKPTTSESVAAPSAPKV